MESLESPRSAALPPGFRFLSTEQVRGHFASVGLQACEFWLRRVKNEPNNVHVVGAFRGSYRQLEEELKKLKNCLVPEDTYGNEKRRCQLLLGEAAKLLERENLSYYG